jgi:hypothetical protein
MLMWAQDTQLTSSRISAHVFYPFLSQPPPHVIFDFISSILCLAASSFIIGGDALGSTNQTYMKINANNNTMLNAMNAVRVAENPQ